MLLLSHHDWCDIRVVVVVVVVGVCFFNIIVFIHFFLLKFDFVSTQQDSTCAHRLKRNVTP